MAPVVRHRRLRHAAAGFLRAPSGDGIAQRSFRLIRRLFAIVAISLLPARLSAEHISLVDAIQSALQSGTQATLARSAEERARILQNQALGSLLPQADARLMRYSESINLQTFGFTIPGQPPVVGPFNVTDAQLTGAIQLFNLAAVRQYQALRQGVQASRYTVEQAENDVAAAVGRLYVLAERASTQIASRESDIALFQRLQQLARDEFQAGTGTRLDVAQATVQLDRARQALLVAQNDQRNTVLALLNAMGRDLGTEVTLDPDLPAPNAPPSLDVALARAHEHRPELHAQDARLRAARLALEAARDRRIPSVGLDFTGDYSGNRADDLRWTRRIAGTLSLPLFRADIQANIANARASLHDVETGLAQRQRDVEQDVRGAILNLQNAEARVSVATENAQVAEEALTVARDRRSAGYGSAVELDRAQDSYRQAREDLIAARADAAAAQLDLEHATGEIRARVQPPTP